MKNKTRSRLFTTILLLGGGLVALSGLTSCNNFLKASEVKKEIEDAIAYANAKSCKLYLKSDAAMGSFLSGNEVNCKVGYTTDLQFTLKKDDWYFVSLEAVSSTDETQSRADFVEYTLNENKSDLERGVYVITVKLLKAADDILIRPKCLEIPCIKTYSPSGTRTQYANTPIVITFSVPVEDETVSQADSIFNYDNIKLTATNVDYSFYNDSFNGDMKDYFYPPEFNSQKTVLTLTPKSELLKQFVAEKTPSFLEINVSLLNITIEQEGISFSLKSGTISNFVIRYNSETETNPPVKSDFFITKKEITLSSAASVDEEDKYKEKESGYWSDGQTKDLLAPSTLYIYGKFYDQDSGVAVIEVTELLEHPDSNSWPLVKPNYTTSYSIKENNACVSYYEDGTGYTSFVIKYTLQDTLSSSPTAGLYSLTVSVKDLCGNTWKSKRIGVLSMEYADFLYTAWDKATNQYLADTSGNIKITPFDVCNAPFSKVSGKTGTYDFAKYNSDIKTIRIKDEERPSVFLLYDNVSPNDITNEVANKQGYIISANDVDYVCEYIDRRGTKRRELFTAYNSTTMERTLVLDVDTVAGKSFDIIPMYNGSPIGRQNFIFPDVPLLYTIRTSAFSIAEPDDSSTNNTYHRIALCKYPDGSCKLVFLSEGGSLTKSNIPDDCTCYFIYAKLRRKLKKNADSPGQEFATKKYSFNSNTKNYDPVRNYTGQNADQTLWTELDSGFDPVSTWFDRGLVAELLGPYSKTQANESALGAPQPSLAMSRGNDGYINVTFQWASNLWEKYDTLVLVCMYDNNLSKKTITLRSTDTFDKDNKVCYTVPIESEKFFKSSYHSVSYVSLSYECKGMKNDVVSPKAYNSADEFSLSGLSEDEIKALDNIKPSALSYSNTACTNKGKIAYEFLSHDFGSGFKSGKVWVNNKTSAKVMSAVTVKNKCYGVQIEISDDSGLIWGNNTLRYKLEDNAGNITEGTLEFDPKNKTTFVHDCLSGVSYSSNTFKATVNSPYASYRINNDDGKGSLKVFGYKSSTGWDETPLAIYNLSNPVPSTGILSVTASGYEYINVIYNYTTDYFSHFYNCGTITAAGKNNYVIPNGTKKDSVVICSSDPKVLVRIYSIKDNTIYKDVCQTWNEDKWDMMGDIETYNGEKNEKIITVSANTPTVFTNNWLKSDNSIGRYYCVVAHFANGDCVASPVMHR
ncbi:MAG: hypothetical protein J5710_08155 [Treponema sp.]|nr:hypothetical protein [Treponema sp.]